MLRRSLLSTLLVCLLAPLASAADAKAEADARKAMDQFMSAFNSRDVKAWAATLNFPHVRLASNTVKVYNSADDFIRQDGDYAKRLGAWDHSRWESMKVIQSGAEKVHFAVEFIRFDKNNKEIGRFPSLYVVTLLDGHWGVQARSSFAP